MRNRETSPRPHCPAHRSLDDRSFPLRQIVQDQPAPFSPARSRVSPHFRWSRPRPTRPSECCHLYLLVPKDVRSPAGRACAPPANRSAPEGRSPSALLIFAQRDLLPPPLVFHADSPLGSRLEPWLLRRNSSPSDTFWRQSCARWGPWFYRGRRQPTLPFLPS